MNNQPIEYKKDTFEEYLSKKDYISASDIKNFLKSPKYYYFEKYEKGVEDSEPHFVIGSALHQLILEPHLFQDNYAVSPKFDRRTKDGKAGYDLFELENEGKSIININDFNMITNMATSSALNKTFIQLIKNSYRETSCYTIDEVTGLKIKLRPDAMLQDKPIITDIKSCLDSSYKKFRQDIYSFQYNISASFYCDFLQKENYVFASIEKQPPYQISLYQLSDELINFGREQYRMALDLIKWSEDNDFWCDYIEFELLKESYKLGNLNTFFDTLEKSELISIIV
jgi:exodeoxyribonuclease VIII